MYQDYLLYQDTGSRFYIRIQGSTTIEKDFLSKPQSILYSISVFPELMVPNIADIMFKSAWTKYYKINYKTWIKFHSKENH